MADQRKPVPMKVGANTMSFMWKTSARKALETLAREGYRCFEVMAQRPHFDPYMKRAEALAFARFLRAAGLTVETINLPSLDQNLASASPEMRDYSVRLFERLIAIAEAIGAAAVVVVTGRVNPLIAPARDVLYLGRGPDFPLALEGALKLKEISYIHAEGYAAGEMKHGPIALIDEAVPVIVLAPSGPLFEKTVSNMQEVRARGGKIVLISDKAGLAEAGEGCLATIEMPKVHPLIAPLVYAVPVQLLAYHVAVAKGTDVDQPRNLAKSVTVE